MTPAASCERGPPSRTVPPEPPRAQGTGALHVPPSGRGSIVRGGGGAGWAALGQPWPTMIPLPLWISNGLQHSHNNVSNVPIWEQVPMKLDRDDREIIWIKVPSHSTMDGNNEAHRPSHTSLATLGQNGVSWSCLAPLDWSRSGLSFCKRAEPPDRSPSPPAQHAHQRPLPSTTPCSRGVGGLLLVGGGRSPVPRA